MAKPGLTYTKRQLKFARRQVASRLDTMHFTNVVPWIEERLRVDTGRMRSSTDASFAEEGSGGDLNMISAEIIIGTDEALPGVRYERNVERPVDYVAALYGPGGHADGELDDIIDELKSDADDIYNGRTA